ncbi:HNH endonuclease signature motif containing protein [Metabacillus fastidiosus]|uniref:HNH endonuclease signature motif containing protein n=1 Tax=Metabacillus fastidiosus TaxID=1458 RepID=UPI003D2DB6E6
MEKYKNVNIQIINEDELVSLKEIAKYFTNEYFEILDKIYIGELEMTESFEKEVERHWKNSFEWNNRHDQFNREISINEMLNKEEHREKHKESTGSSYTSVQNTRSQKLSRKLKELYSDQCQICCEGADEHKPEGKYFTETHHIKPISENEPDIEENIMVLCKNCHSRFHDFSFKIVDVNLSNKVIYHKNPNHRLDGIKITLKHHISSRFISYCRFGIKFD